MVADTDAKTEILELNELPNTHRSDLIKSVSNTLEREGLRTGGARAGSVWGNQWWVSLPTHGFEPILVVLSQPMPASQLKGRRQAAG